MATYDMAPDVYAVLAADTDVATLLTDSDGRLRAFPFGEAPQQYARPYVVWQPVSGEPDNTLADTPTSDRMTLQFDVYGPTADAVRQVAAAIRVPIELVAYLTRYHGETKEPGSGHDRIYRLSFDVDWRFYRA